MFPRFSKGSYVFAIPLWMLRFYAGWQLSSGDAVIVKHPEFGIIVKAIEKEGRDQRFLLTGENSNSVSSEKMGWVSKKEILGRVIYSVSPSAE